jgi:hypothetical protein
MIILPIVDRELRVAARRHSTYWVRLAVAMLAIVVGIFLYLANLRTPPQLLAKAIFAGLAALALLFCLASGRRSTADCLSSEKREGTLGLLFLTDLKGYDVIFGKLAATSLNAFYGLLAIFPVLAVPLLMGGVTNGEFWRTLLVLVNTFLFSLAVGVLASVWSRDARRAMGVNFLLLLALVVPLPACAWALAAYLPTHPYVPQLLYTMPFYTLYLAADIHYRFEVMHFWCSVGILHSLTWLMIALASSSVPRCWQDRPERAGRTSFRERWRTWTYGTEARRRRHRTRLLAVNAFYWLASRAWLKPMFVWGFLAFMAGWWLFVGLKLEFKWLDESFCLTTAIILNGPLKLWIAVEAGQQLAEDQKMGTLELLLSTPLSVRDILRGQLLALRRQFLRPVLLVIALELLLTFLTARGALNHPRPDWLIGLGMVFMLVADVLAVIWVGMFAALTARNPNHASVGTILRVLLLPVLIWAALLILATVWAGLRRKQEPEWEFFFGTWFCLGILADLGFGLPAWWRVKTRFRELALRQLSPTHAAGA